MSLGFALWALANMASLARTQNLLVTLTTSMNAAAQLPAAPPTLRPFLTQISTAPTWEIIVFHVTIDIIVLGAIWWPTLGKARITESKPSF